MSVLSKLSSFENDIDFRRVWRIGVSVSVALMLAGAVAIVSRGLNLGIDFEGGTSWDVPSESLSTDDARDALRPLGEGGAKVQTIGRGSSRIVRVQSSTSDLERQSDITEALTEAAGVSEVDISVSTVGPSWGDQVTEKAQRALVYFFLLIGLYMAVRLEWKIAIGALASVIHDLLIAVGLYAALQIEITPATVIAFLTILGYSLYDTVVVFDRVKLNTTEILPTGKMTYTDVVSLSLNQVLMRSINTTITSLLPVLGMLIIGSYVLGALALQEFALALAVGMVSGAASSLFIAAPLVSWLKEREPRNREIRERRRRAAGPVTNPVRDEPATVPATGASSRPVAAPPALSGRAIPPRPRKKGKKR